MKACLMFLVLAVLCSSCSCEPQPRCIESHTELQLRATYDPASNSVKSHMVPVTVCDRRETKEVFCARLRREGRVAEACPQYAEREKVDVQ